MKKWVPLMILILVFIFWGLVLKNEFFMVLIWWGILLIIGLMFFPLSIKIFSSFTDKGFLFSKVTGLAITSYLLWFLSYLKILSIRSVFCWGVVFLTGMIVHVLFFGKKQDRKIVFQGGDTAFWVFTGESIFLFSLSFWTWLRGFNPRIEGLEKFMDYGFVNSILQSGKIPPQDMWFAGESINYYYYGQYVTAFLTRLSRMETEITYNIMMATLFAFSMSLCFILVANLLRGFGVKKNGPVILGGLISAFLVSLGGNLHAFFYGLLVKVTQGKDKYWFPDATRYIGYNPETHDKTIHEFPVYSFVVSDLHAHVINMVFVLTLLGLLLAILRKFQKRTDEGWRGKNLAQVIFIPELVLLGMFIGIFQMSNYWDFPIYLTVTLFVFFAAGLRRYGYTVKMTGITFLRFLSVILISLLFALPFNLTFENITSGIRLTESRSMLHQLLILWGYQLTLVFIFAGFILFTEQNLQKKISSIHGDETKLLVRIKAVLEKNSVEDVFAVILCISAIGLVIIPEIVYVKDIYTGDYKRANTMFKLTYQAFIMFGLVAGYIVIRIRQIPYRNWKLNAIRIISILMILLPMIYPFYAVPSWYKSMKPDQYQGLDGLAFMKNEYPDDYALVMWLRENVQGQPVILEANGDSYSYNGRISMASGLPTIQGWYVHEWLWRDNPNIVQARVDEVQVVYESDDREMSQKILDKYQVAYIVIGEIEYNNFPDINEDKLKSFGTVVFERPTLKLIQVNYNES